MNTYPLRKAWNLDFTKRRRDNIRRFMRQQLRCTPKGRGNRAWKRAQAIWREPGTLIWPDYALPFAVAQAGKAGAR